MSQNVAQNCEESHWLEGATAKRRAHPRNFLLCSRAGARQGILIGQMGAHFEVPMKHLLAVDVVQAHRNLDEPANACTNAFIIATVGPSALHHMQLIMSVAIAL